MFDSTSFLKTLTTKPGVYQMLNAVGEVVYVGKANNLRRRIVSYFQKSSQTSKTSALMRQVVDVKIIITANENEALLLEDNLIKLLKPRYNILFRDDKSYPYITLTNDDFPRLMFHRGFKQNRGSYFGPYPHVNIVRKTISCLQKSFLLRSCKNSYFKTRIRPCLQYQIGYCSAPCSGLISKKNYVQGVRYVSMFLKGQSDLVIDELVERMQSESAKKNYEIAAKYRDQINQLRKCNYNRS